MADSLVYFTDFRTTGGISIPHKLQKLARAAGIEQIDFQGKFVAIKLHFGEPGNLGFLRPNYARALVDLVRDLGGKPFLTDCNTLYPGQRKNALEHLEAAWENGFTPLTVGCPIIIGDGLKGTDEAVVPLPQGEYIKEAYIGQAVMDADIIISLSHFKGHEATGFGGAIKNIGMGCASRAGKMVQHKGGKPSVKRKRCHKCRLCLRQCAHNAISFDAEGIAAIDENKCVGCGRCIGGCNFDAIANFNDSANHDLNCKMAEYTLATLQGRPQFHINVVRDISPFCDCYAHNDAPILPDVGMFAAFDPLALDQACVDACLQQQPLSGSLLSERMSDSGFCDHHDHFLNVTPESEWRSCLEHAEKIGLGSRSYRLVSLS